MKFRLCNMCVCTTLTHACEEWNLTKAVSRILNGVNSRCLHVITRVPWYRHFSSIKHVAGRTTATSPLPVIPATSPAWQCGAPNTTCHEVWRQPSRYPEGSIFMDCQGSELKDLETRTAWRHKVATLVFYCYIASLDPLGPLWTWWWWWLILFCTRKGPRNALWTYLSVTVRLPDFPHSLAIPKMTI